MQHTGATPNGWHIGLVCYYKMLENIDLHSAKTTVTAAGLTCDLLVDGAGGVHKQLHGTGQGAVEGPLTWIPIADS